MEPFSLIEHNPMMISNVTDIEIARFYSSYRLDKVEMKITTM